MGRNSLKLEPRKEPTFGPDTIETVMRTRIRTVIETLVEEELTAALGAARSIRVGEARQGYRHGTRGRTLTTSLGPTTVTVPRARLRGAAGATEWQSGLLERYQRRTRRVDEAILGIYLAGANTRRIRLALAPLLRGGPLSKDAVSRVIGRLKTDFATWQQRDLASDQIRYLFLDGWYPKVRVGGRRARVPVLVALGVRATGARVVLDLRLMGTESATGWRTLLQALVARHLGRPLLAVGDGNPGLEQALEMTWPGLPLQRCTAHKLRNLLAKAPRALHEELAEDYRRMIYGETAEAVQRARVDFRQTWRRRCPGVVTSLDEAGDALFTFLAFPSSQWKALRTTNALERINEEFRRRTKTQGALPSEDAVVLLAFGLLRSGAIRLRRLEGWQDIPQRQAQRPRLKKAA